MGKTLRTRRWWLAAAAALTVAATGGIAYATIPDAGGVVHTCFTKSSGAWRVIDTGLGQSCKTNELPLDVYSKGGADAVFLDQTEANGLYLGKTEKAADSDKLDGQDSSAFLGSSSKAADSDKLDGVDSRRYAKGLETLIVADFERYADGFVGFSRIYHPAQGAYPGLSFDLTCDADGVTTLIGRSPERFTWWWNNTSGEATGSAPPYTQTFQVGSGVESNSFRAVFTRAWYTTKVELDSAIGGGACALAWTMMNAANDSAGP